MKTKEKGPAPRGAKQALDGLSDCTGGQSPCAHRDDGTLKPNFRPLPANMSVERYAFGVYIELHKALKGLVEK